MQARRAFPAWPAEDILLRLRDERLRQALASHDGDSLPLVGNWPAPHTWSFVVTHDVEGPAGIERIPRALELERRYGVVSSWNFCAEWYEIPPGTFAQVREAGCEVGLHGIRHDGRLFSTRAEFEASLPKIQHYLAAWEAEGFRSPAMHRNADWMHELGARYDSSFPDSDPFEPQAGGCCSILPFFFGELVELPVTLVQDHTLWEILRRTDIGLWTTKAGWIAEHNGLVNVIVHPDYLDTQRRWEMYEQLLAYLTQLRGGWHALPREVATWWRERELLGVGGEQGAPSLTGPRTPATAAATLWRARIDDDGGLRVGP
ncbi:MAG: hypothetical protein NVSMB51_18230 [Solirubrobacteraceae bacterium]